jgi:hypothetical protein
MKLNSRKLILHIGTEKTGTSTLQKYLSENRLGLLQQGFLYPISTSGTDHYKIALAFYDAFKDDDLAKIIHVYSESEWEKFRIDFLYDLKEQFKKNQCHTTIISCEHLHSRLLSPSEKLRIKFFFEECGFDEIRIVVYIREQVSLANSLYSTAVCYGFTGIDIPGPDDPHINCLCDHKKTIESWSSVFGLNNLIVRLYDPDRQSSFSTVVDFLSLFPDLNTTLFKFVTESNMSLSCTGISIIRRINELEPRIKDGVINPVRRGIEHIIQKKYNGDKYRMPQKLASLYINTFANSNEWVRKNWYPERFSLFISEKIDDNNGVLDCNKKTIFNIDAESLKVLKKLRRKYYRRRLKSKVSMLAKKYLHHKQKL